ncbi:hypothetical protein HYQ45_002716 [Verticillium longisporum]|nr:hypothetical protein HYQ45_002716 [Verticillium longisporum]
MAPKHMVFDGVAIFWTAFASLWTALLVGGMAFLWTRRDMPILRIRGLPLSFGAVVCLHLYWIACQLGTSYGHLMPNGVEFWIMGIYLPFGIALFHASNSRFLHVAKAQMKYAQVERVKKTSGKKSRWPLVAKFRSFDYTTKMMTVVCAGMTFQFFLTLVMYLVSYKFHPSFGVAGTEVTGTPEQITRERGRGWEWWPSVFWQIFWAWIVAPYILWQSRGIRDTQGWRFQTVACCLASLHAAPMWIVALNVDAMAVVNKYFIPPQWIAVSIMLLEICTIFLPCWQVLRHQSLRQETLELIALWESGKKNTTGAGKSFVSGSTKTSGKGSFVSWRQMSEVEKGGSFDAAAIAGGLLTMDALEYALKKNPAPLQHFSALKDFSGENIAFLTSVSSWKTSLRSENVPATTLNGRQSLSIEPCATNQQDRLREQFNQALRIYTEFISQRDAEFSINISSGDLRRIETVFEQAARSVHGDKSPKPTATPFDDWAAPKGAESVSMSSEKGIIGAAARDADDVSDTGSTIGEGAYYWGDIPDGFDETVFDDAETSIKYLVLTNTWPKFVKDRRTSFDSAESNESYDTLIDMVVRRTQVFAKE